MTVKIGNAPWATVAHWLVAMTLLAMVADDCDSRRCPGRRERDSAARNGASRRVRHAPRRCLQCSPSRWADSRRSIPGASVACTSVPLCGRNPAVDASAVRADDAPHASPCSSCCTSIGLVAMLRQRRDEEAPIVVRAASIALGMVLLQFAVASSMVLLHLPPVLRSLHEATGVGIWLSCFVLAYLARRTSRREPATVEHRHAARAAALRPRTRTRFPHPAPNMTDAVVETRTRSFVRDLVALTKPRIISLLLVTTIAPMFVAGSPAGRSCSRCSSAAT